MRRHSNVLLLVLLSLTLVLPSGAHADRGTDQGFWFNVIGTVPCAVACPYWPVTAGVGYRPCENPVPDTSYRDVVTTPAPDPIDGHVRLVVDIYPAYDWDLWICGLLANGSHNGPELAAGRHILGESCRTEIDLPTEPFTGGLGRIPLGCHEQATTDAAAGVRYVIRGYNWIDHEDCPGFYHWEIDRPES